MGSFQRCKIAKVLFFYSLQIYLWHSQERVIRCVWRLLEDHFDDFFIPIHFYSILIEMVCMAMRDVNDCHDLRDLVMVNTLWFTQSAVLGACILRIVVSSNGDNFCFNFYSVSVALAVFAGREYN